MKTRLLADPVRYLRMTTSELREAFLIGSLYQPGSIQMNLCRSRSGSGGHGCTWSNIALTLPSDDALKSAYFTERRELGALNIGGEGHVSRWRKLLLAGES